LRFLLDENIPGGIAAALRAGGHDVVEASAQPMRGAPDENLWLRAAGERRIFVTRDIGAANLSLRPAPPGVILLRVPYRMRGMAITATFVAFWHSFDPAGIPGNLVVLRPGRYRCIPLRP
jgi:hypothetical protein